jgi:DNA repair ATPase RecN
VDCEDGELTLYREFFTERKECLPRKRHPDQRGCAEQIGDTLVDIHDSNAHQSLLDGKKHIVLLDRFAGRDALELKSRVSGSIS